MPIPVVVMSLLRLHYYKRADQALYQSKNNGRNQVSMDLSITEQTRTRYEHNECFSHE